MLKTLICAKPKDKINTCIDLNGAESFIVQTTFQTIANIMNNKKENLLETPIFQAPLDEDKVYGQLESYLKNKSYFLNKSLLTLANIKIGNEEVNYIVDGQHRMEMIKILYEQQNENMKVFIAIHMIKSEEELRDLFDDINKDSTKNLQYVKLPIFAKQEIDAFKKLLTLKYVGCYAKNRTQVSHIKTPHEFVIDLETSGFFSAHSDKTVNEKVTYIDNQHALFFNCVEYLENDCKNPSCYYKDESNLIKHYKNVMFFKNNNFVDFLVTDDEPQHFFTKNTRKSMTKSKRLEVWNKEFGNKKTGLCPVKGCKQLLRLEEQNSFHCGHITSIKYGGSNDLSNLRPICANCNGKMGYQNWNDFILTIENEQEEIERLFETKAQEKIDIDCDDDEYGTIDCDVCSKSIGKNMCIYIKIQDVPSLVCLKCYLKYK